MDKQRILITVKTYPTLSRKYGETVCTAGVREDGSWVRMYPVPFRRLDEVQQYEKFDWVECRLVRNKSDPRPETYRPVDEAELIEAGHIDTSDKWRERRRLLLQTCRVYDSLDELIAEAKANTASLAVFKPTKVADFVWEEDEREWNSERVKQMRDATKQYDLFADNTWRETFKLIPKLPYKSWRTLPGARARCRSSIGRLGRCSGTASARRRATKPRRFRRSGRNTSTSS